MQETAEDSLRNEEKENTNTPWDLVTERLEAAGVYRDNKLSQDWKLTKTVKKEAQIESVCPHTSTLYVRRFHISALPAEQMTPES